MRSFLRRLGAGHADADDIAQDTFVTAWSILHRWHYDGSVRAWLCAIAWNRWKIHVRAAVRRGARDSIEAELRHVAALDGESLDATRALDSLPADQRAAVALCLGADFSHAEAAIVLGMTLGTVKSHVVRGRDKLARLLGARRERI